MHIDIDVDPELGPDWTERVYRQIHFNLSGTGSVVSRLSAYLRLAPESDPPVYECCMRAILASGWQPAVTHRSEQPNMCVADTAARLARSIRRERLFSGSTAQLAHGPPVARRSRKAGAVRSR